ncbi:MAG: glycoside hydrolase family 2, partial [Bacteroidales bacterium]|nr:glycoside hydrolase family 2 [Bacteroidales bacterium]
MKKLGIPTLTLLFCITTGFTLQAQDIPLPEHPRPDFQRENWINLNGPWSFSFDSLNIGLDQKWFDDPAFDLEIMVPFPWGSELSGLKNLAEVGWYSRQLEIPEQWDDKRVFLVIGACDWKSTVWLDGKSVGSHQGGYNQFDFDLSPFVVAGNTHQLVIRVDDTPHPFKLEGKQGYGEAKGIWQTVFLEQRGEIALETIHFTPDIDNGKVKITALLDQPARENLYVNLVFPGKEIAGIITSPRISKKQRQIEFEVSIPNPHLWDLDDPYLYNVKVQLHNNETVHDELTTYFGMRKISIMDLPGTEYPYVALNNKPVYLQLSLDQAYHPEGFYTYPSDEFMRDEIIRSKKIGLNGNRIHIKVEIPRKLYWADKLGLLIMADVPNFWGEPTETA